MAWDTARTQQLLLTAAVEEFAEHGPEGARIARIATRAGVNKERIYQYFGNKEQLFAAVLTAEMGKLAASVPLTPQHAEDLADYAGRCYDYHVANPHFTRLLAWEGLQRGAGPGFGSGEPLAAESERLAHYAEKVGAIAAAQRAEALTDELDPGRLMFAVIALVTSWIMLPQLTRLLFAPPNSPQPASDREAIMLLARKMTTRSS
ncbi:TetR/AcrR family transcriptional regulator [Streptacidiphilus pinicola]|uniref:TetR/AcrR family transcriptional regulator n=1 Tax=Streptacidiphilus pinicola TaxID=2219663 RepID=A0A2X0IM03_9ACTN|nr:TetR family transcriptional regulator [Streptacidiphilus pinicola]RAG86152.1 TetR/AcrR family transcriptional regulator [Streptacidiphilus pinicola]